MFEAYIVGYIVAFMGFLVGGTVLVVRKEATLGELLCLLLFMPLLSWVIVAIGIIHISYDTYLDKRENNDKI